MHNNRYKRAFTHLVTSKRKMLSYFSRIELDKIEYMITHSEKKHLGEILCVIESNWDLMPVLKGKTPCQRALDIFGLSRLWDTAENNGVLLYISFADKSLEIIADRGLKTQIPDSVWNDICKQITALFQQEKFAQGINLGLKLIDDELSRAYPRVGIPYHNEFPNQVIIY